MEWQIYTYGNLDVVYNTFMSIGGFFGSGGIVTGMVRLAGITAILMFVTMASGLTLSGNSNQPLDVMFFIKFYLIYAIFVMTPAYRININDVTTATTKPITLTSGAMIPIGLVVINSYTSTLFYDLTQAYQKYFEVGTDSSATYTKGGLSFGSNFVTNLPRFSSGDADFEQNTTEYIANCALPLSYSQFGGINNLMSSTDMFGAFASIPNQGSRFVMYVDSSGKSNAIGCDQSLTQLQTYWSGHKDVFLKNISNQAGFNTTKLQTIFSAAANSSANSLLGVNSSSGSDALKQAMIMNMTYRAVQTSATKVNNAALANAAYDAQQFQQYQAGGMLSSEQAGRLVPALKSFMEVMMIMIYPLMVFFALMTSSFKPVFKYMQIAATLSAIPFIYEILNSVTFQYALQHSTATGAYNMMNAANMYSLNANVVAAANYLSMAVPVIAYSIVTGTTYAITSVMSHSTDPGKNTANTAGNDLSKGNMSMGSYSVDNTSYGNYSANQFSNAMNMNTGAGQVNERLGSGTMSQTSQDGSHALQQMKTGAQMSMGSSNAHNHALQEQYSQAVSEQQSAQAQFQNAYRNASQYADGHGVAHAGAHDGSTGVNVTSGTSGNSSNDHSKRAALEASASGGFNTSGIGGEGAGGGSGYGGSSAGGYGAKVGGTYSDSNTTGNKITNTEGSQQNDVNSWKHSDAYNNDKSFKTLVDKAETASHSYAEATNKVESLSKSMNNSDTSATNQNVDQSTAVTSRLIDTYGEDVADKIMTGQHPELDTQNIAGQFREHLDQQNNYSQPNSDSVVGGNKVDDSGASNFTPNANSTFDSNKSQAMNNAQAAATAGLGKGGDAVVNEAIQGEKDGKSQVDSSRRIKTISHPDQDKP